MHDADPASPIDQRSRRRTARDGMFVIVLCGLLLLLLAGPGVRRAGERMDPGLKRTVVLGIGKPAGWVADQLPFASANARLKSWLSPDDDLSGSGSPGNQGAAFLGEGGVTADAFDPRRLGQPGPARRTLKRVLVTGDSMTMPMDAELSRMLSEREGVRTLRQPHIGTGISKPDIVDWTQLARKQVDEDKPDAVVMFLGANEGFPLITPRGGVDCCSAEWAAAYATTARVMAETYRQRGAGRLYWLTLPMPRDPDRQKIARVVNEAVRVALTPFRAQARVVETTELFTPGGRWRDAMDVGGRRELVRDPDGIHLNKAGGRLAAEVVLRELSRDFGV